MEYHDWKQTNVWVGFATDQPWINKDNLPIESIEIFVSMLTSLDSCFTGHMGIGRSLTYNGEKHKNISMKLHSFVALASLKIYPDKVYMLTVAASRMREIMVKNFINAGMAADLFIGDGNDKICLRETAVPQLDSLIILLFKRLKMRLRGYKKLVNHLDEYELNELAIACKVVNNARTALARFPSVTAKIAPDSVSYKSFNIYDLNGEVIQTIYPDVMKGSMAWFFESRYFVVNKRQPLLCVDLKSLSRIISWSGRLSSVKV